jgi:hypothetical protein
MRAHRRTPIIAGLLLALGAAAPAGADTTVVTASATDLAVSGERVFWSDPVGSGLARLMVAERGTVRAVPVRREPVRFAPVTGTDASGAAALVYCRGTSRACSSLHVLTVADRRERRLDVPIPRGCMVLPPALERGAVLYALRGASCPRRGIWLRSRSGRLRRVTTDHEVCCVALVNGAAAWLGAIADADVVFVKVARPGRRPFVLYRSSPSGIAAAPGGLVAHGGRLHWGVTAETRGGAYPRAFESRVIHARPVPRAACEGSDRTFPSRSRSAPEGSDLRPPVFAVAAGGVFYADAREIRRADAPAPVFGPQHSFGSPSAGRLGAGCTFSRLRG